MAAPCWKCRAGISVIFQVYDVSPTGPCPICMDNEDPQVCVAAPCGHHICGSCARHWATRQNVYISVPAAPASRAPPAVAVDPEAEQVAEQEAEQVAEQEAEQVAEQLADPEPHAADPMMPPPWVLDPSASPAIPLPFAMVLPLPVRVPAMGEAFLFEGRLVAWVMLWRFGTNIVLVWADTGLLCQGGDHVVRPTGIAGWLVKWHPAGERANRKWFLQAEVHDV